MTTKAEMIAEQLLNANINRQTWGPLAVVVTIYSTINAAIAAAVARGSAEVIFPDGTYTLTSPVSATIAADSKIRLVGYGNVVVQSTIAEPADYSSLFTFTGGANSEIEIENITINHTYASSNRGKLSGIRIESMNRVYMKNVGVNGFSDMGIDLYNSDNGMVLNCQASNNKYLGLGMRICSDVEVIGGAYNSNGGNNGGTLEGYGVSGQTSSAPDYGFNERITVRGVKAFDNVGKGIDFHSGKQVIIDGNHIKGFRYNGIYAICESVSKVVADVTITNNIIDGGTPSNPCLGIQVGSRGDQALDSGTFIIENNIINNIAYATSYGIMIENPAAGGIAPQKVIISGNTIEDFDSALGAPIRFNADTVKIPEAIVSNNIIHAVTANIGIWLDAVEQASIIGNHLKVDSGTTAYAIYTGIANVNIIGNQFSGGATYTNSILLTTANKRNVYGNIMKGIVLGDDLAKFRKVADLGKQFEFGSTTVNVASGTKSGVGNANFGSAFTSAPIVFVMIQNGNALADAEKPCTCDPYGITVNGFNIAVYLTANAAAARSLTVAWMAIGG